MWDAVRREVAALQWEVEPPLTQTLLAEWSTTVDTMMTLRRALGPVPADDPLALLATATLGATRTGANGPPVAASLQGVDAALAAVARDAALTPASDRQREVAALNQVAYELAHWVRVRTPDAGARAWLLAGETALDLAIHTPGRARVGVGLAAWTDALAAVQPVHATPIVRRSVALGHLAILRDTHRLVTEAQRTGALRRPYSEALLAQIRELARACQATLAQIDGRHLGASRADQAVMLTVGVAVRQFTARPDPHEEPHDRLDALLRSGLGQAVVVANITGDATAHTAAVALQRLTWDYLADPGLLRATEPPASPSAARSPAPPPARAVADVPAADSVASGRPTIKPGTVLDADTVLALCQSRDLGVAAATADRTNPPEVLRGIDPARWPQLVAEGRQAVTDLVASVIPMVYAQTRRAFNAPDIRGQMFVELMGAAQRFDPQRVRPDFWANYAWTTLLHSRGRGVDHAGVVRRRTTTPRPPAVALEGVDPASREPDPSTRLEERQAITNIRDAVAALPTTLRGPLLASMEGLSGRQVADEFGFSESTARRRLAEARDNLQDRLAPTDDLRDVPYETLTDPVLERSQRLYEAMFAPTLGPEPARGPDR